MPNWRQVGTFWAYVQLEMRRFVRGSREISLASSLLRASTDALISYWTGKNKTFITG